MLEKLKIYLFLILAAIVFAFIGAIVPALAGICGFISKACLVIFALVFLGSVFQRFFGDF